MTTPEAARLGWVGLGRMGSEMCKRLVEAGQDVSIYNRTAEKARPLADLGARVVERPVELAGCRVVFTMMSDADAFRAVTLGPGGLLSGRKGPEVIVDSSTIGAADSTAVAEVAMTKGTHLLAAPVSGNPKVVAGGGMVSVVSGPADAWLVAKPFLERIAAAAVYVGEGEVARLVKIAHNLYLGAVIQALAEVTILVHRAGISRADFLSFLNQSPMGSVFTGYKAPALVNLDFHPSFTGHLLRKDLELGLEAARELNVALPTVATVHQMVMSLIGSGLGDEDFAALIVQQARMAGVDLVPEGREVPDGLGPPLHS